MTAFFQYLTSLARRYPVAFVSIVLLLGLGVADWLLWKRWVNLAVESERSHAQGEAMLLSLSNHSRIQTQLSETGAALAYIDRNLAIESDLAGNLDYFYQIEKTTHSKLANLSQLSLQPTTDKQAYLAIPFSLRLSGSYSQILAYLHELETGPRIVRFKRFSFQQGGASDGLSLDLTVDMLGRQ